MSVFSAETARFLPISGLCRPGHDHLRALLPTRSPVEALNILNDGGFPRFGFHFGDTRAILAAQSERKVLR